MKKFTKDMLRDEDIVKYRCGDLRTIKDNGLYDRCVRYNDIGTYHENMKCPFDGDLDIVEVYRSIWKCDEPTITSDDKNYFAKY